MSSQSPTSAAINPRSMSVWMRPAACRTVEPLRTVQALALLLCRGEEGDEPEQAVRGPHELLEARRLYPEHRQVLGGLLLRELDDLGFELRGDTDRLGALTRRQLLDPRAVAVPFRHGLLVHVRHVQRGLGGDEGAHRLRERL